MFIIFDKTFANKLNSILKVFIGNNIHELIAV